MLEPLRRNETPFLRQVADGARMAADIGPGATVMGDFWHMGLEETSFMGAFICAGKLLSHVHIAGLKQAKAADHSRGVSRGGPGEAAFSEEGKVGWRLA